MQVHDAGLRGNLAAQLENWPVFYRRQTILIEDGNGQPGEERKVEFPRRIFSGQDADFLVTRLVPAERCPDALAHIAPIGSENQMHAQEMLAAPAQRDDTLRVCSKFQSSRLIRIDLQLSRGRRPAMQRDALQIILSLQWPHRAHVPHLAFMPILLRPGVAGLRCRRQFQRFLRRRLGELLVKFQRRADFMLRRSARPVHALESRKRRQPQRSL